MSAKSPPPPPPAPRLYLATPPISDPASMVELLPSLLATADVAAVLLRLAPADPRTLTQRAKAIAPLVQTANAALLLDGQPEIAARAGADGAHLHGIEGLADALSSLKPERIVGVGSLATRHDAMVAGEAGADYVLFGEPDASGHRPAPAAIAERLDWWAELFEPPCVGYAETLEEVGLFARAGADFIMAGDLVFADPGKAAAMLMDVARTIGSNPRGADTAGRD